MATAPMLAAPHSSAALLHWLDLLAQQHRLTPRSPIPGPGLEHAGEPRSTIHAAPVLGKMPAGQVEPVTADQQRATAAAPGAAARHVMNIACIDTEDAGSRAAAMEGDPDRAREVHLPVVREDHQRWRRIAGAHIARSERR
jgi:hypothetical protein